MRSLVKAPRIAPGKDYRQLRDVSIYAKKGEELGYLPSPKITTEYWSR